MPLISSYHTYLSIFVVVLLRMKVTVFIHLHEGNSVLIPVWFGGLGVKGTCLLKTRLVKPVELELKKIVFKCLIGFILTFRNLELSIVSVG